MAVSRILNDISIGGYVPGNSPLHKLDPRTKLLGLLVLLVAVFSSGSLSGTVASVTAAFGLAALSGAGWPIWAWSLSRFKWMLALAFGANLFVVSGGSPVVAAGTPLPVTDQALRFSCLFTFQLTAAIMLSMTLTFTTTPTELMKGCHRLAYPLKRIGLPIDELGLVLLLAMRFVPLLQEELRTTTDAQKARGVEFGAGPIVARARNLLSVLMPALTAALRRAELLAVAMAARAYRPGAPRSEYRPMRLRTVDWLGLLIIAGFILCQRLLEARVIF